MTTTTNLVPEVLMAPLFHLELVRDRDIAYAKSGNTTEEVAQVLHEMLDRSPTEKHAVLYLDFEDRITGAEVVGMGGLGSVLTPQMEVVRGALVHGAPKIVMSHNHPVFGMPKPSHPDIVNTIKMIDFAASVGVVLKDHIIVNPDGHYSIREHQMDLTSEWMEAQMEAHGLPALPPEIMKALKDKLLNVVKGVHDKSSVIEEAPDFFLKKSGEGEGGKSNLPFDWTNSLTYDYLTR